MKRKAIDWEQVAELRDATLSLVEREELIGSGYWGACTVGSEWLIERGFPAQLVEPLIWDFHDGPIIRWSSDGRPRQVEHVRGVSFLALLWKLAEIFRANVKDAQECFGRKTCARLLAASIKRAINDACQDKLFDRQRGAAREVAPLSPAPSRWLRAEDNEVRSAYCGLGRNSVVRYNQEVKNETTKEKAI